MAAQPSQAYPADIVRGTFFERDVPFSQMFVHFRTMPDGYARPLRVHRVKELIATYDPQYLGVLLLSLRQDGRFAVLDGQHRIEVAKHFKLHALDAYVYIDLSVEDEARLYRKFGENLKQSALDRFFAGLAEKLPEYLAINRIVGQNGLHIPNSLGSHPRTIDAVQALTTVASTYGLDTLDDTLKLLRDAFGDEHRAFRSVCLMGTAAFLTRFKTHKNYNRKRLVSRMERGGLSALERQTLSVREASLAANSNAAWGQALTVLHDYRVDEDKKLGEWPRRHLSEDVVATARKTLAANMARMTPQQRSDSARKGNASLTPEERTARTLKAARTKYGFTPRQVPCAHCGAPAGDKCVTALNRPAGTWHDRRKRDAKAWASGKLRP